MKTRNDCEIACGCVKLANVVLHVDLCKEIFARKHTATHKPTSISAQSPHVTTTTHTHTHTPNNRLWSPLAYGLGAIISGLVDFDTVGSSVIFGIRFRREYLAGCIFFLKAPLFLYFGREWDNEKGFANGWRFDEVNRQIEMRVPGLIGFGYRLPGSTSLRCRS